MNFLRGVARRENGHARVAIGGADRSSAPAGVAQDGRMCWWAFAPRTSRPQRLGTRRRGRSLHGRDGGGRAARVASAGHGDRRRPAAEGPDPHRFPGARRVCRSGCSPEPDKMRWLRAADGVALGRPETLRDAALAVLRHERPGRLDEAGAAAVSAPVELGQRVHRDRSGARRPGSGAARAGELFGPSGRTGGCRTSSSTRRRATISRARTGGPAPS